MRTLSDVKQTARESIAAFLDDLERRGISSGTQRQRGRYLTEYLEHALAAEDAPTELTAAELMELSRAEAWLEDAKAGRTRQRNTLRGPAAESSDATDRIRRITYNLFAEYVGIPWSLDVPPNTVGERLTPDEARRLIHEASVRRPPAVNAAAWIRSAALAALVAASDRPIADLARLTLDDVQFDRATPRVLLEDGPVPLDPQSADVLRRWLRQRAGITAQLQGSDPGHLWIPIKPGRPRGGVEPPPPGINRASVRTLHAAHRRLVLELLGAPVPPGALRTVHSPAPTQSTRG